MHASWFRGLGLLVAAVSGAGTAAPSPAPAPARPEPEPVVVTGAADLDEQIKQFVRILAPSAFGQVSRFEAALCPRALGLSAGTAGAVEQRLRSVADAVGVRVSKPGCRPNLLVIVTRDKQAFLQGLWRQRPDYLGNLTPAQFRRLTRVPGPAVAWQLGGMLGQSGKLLSDDPGRPSFNISAGSGSRMTQPVRPVFDRAVVVVEARALPGLTTTQLADYAAMRSLAGADPGKFTLTNEPTVLRVVDAADDAVVPAGLTAWDVGYLRGLYHAREFVNGPAQRSDIRRQMKRQLGAEPDKTLRSGERVGRPCVTSPCSRTSPTGSAPPSPTSAPGMTS